MDLGYQGRIAGFHDAFASLRNDGGGQRMLPALIKQQQEQAKFNQAREALKQAQQGGGLPMGFDSPAMQAYGAHNPVEMLRMAAQASVRPEQQPDPWAGTKTVDGNVLRMGADGPETIYSAPQGESKAQSAMAKLAQDLKNGLITPEDFKAARAKLLRDPNGIVIGPDGTVSIGGAAPTAIKTEAIKGRNAYDSIMTGLTDYEALTKEGGAIIPGKKKDKLDVARRSLQLQMKELFNLGVLNGPDLALMDQLLVDMTSIENNALDAVGIADLGERTEANVTQLRKMMTDLIEPKLRSAGQSSVSAKPLPPLSDMSNDDLDAQIKRLQGQ